MSSWSKVTTEEVWEKPVPESPEARCGSASLLLLQPKGLNQDDLKCEAYFGYKGASDKEENGVL